MPRPRTPIVFDLSNPDKLILRLSRHSTIRGFFGCWEWNGFRSHDGYGIAEVKTVDGRFVPGKVHRLAFAIVYGQPPDGKQLHHECRNRACWNPMHVKPTTTAEHGVEHRSDVCPKGHPLSGDNLLAANEGTTSEGKRRCRTCANERAKGYNHAKSTFHRGEHKTECKHGHPWVPENIYTKPSTGHRECMECHRIAERNRQAKQRAARRNP